jgi:hypothetical protein
VTAQDTPRSKFRGLRRLLIIHGLITLAASIVLTIAPGAIPGIVGIHLEPGSYLVAYLLAAAEFGFAVLSFGGSRLNDPQALRLVAWSCIAFHASSGVLALYAYPQNNNGLILVNVAARAVIVALFAFLSR